MKNIRRKTSAGFTLLELLLVITVVAILMAILLPAIENSRKRAKQAACVANLKQIYVAFQLFKDDHNGESPTGVSTNEGGVREIFFLAPFVYGDWANSIYRVFQALSNSLVSPKLLVCLADNRVPANSFAELTNTNISYSLSTCFLCFGPPVSDQPDLFWAADRNVRQQENELRFTREMHQWRGNVLFADGHVEQLSNAELAQNRLLGSGNSLVPPAGPGGTSSSVAGTSGAGGSEGVPNAQASASSRSSPSSSGSASAGSSSSAGSRPAGSPAAGSAGGTLDRLENFFTGKPGGKAWTSRTSAAPSSVTNPLLSPAPFPRPSTINPSNPAPVALAVESPEPIMDRIARAGSRSRYWLFLLLLLIVAAMAVQRRWQKRRLKEAAEQEGA